MTHSPANNAELESLAKQLKKKVNGLLSVYGLLIIGTLIFFLLVLAAVVGIGYWMLSSGRVNYRALILLIGAIIIAGICVKTVLGPLFKIFERPKPKGEKITRADYPELFEVIDDVVKKVDCLDPKNVYISNECNAYVYNPGLLGYLFHGRQNLTIGLPLLMAFNKTELKAILAHEFGHFTQKSVSVNRTANLSEFICASIDRMKDQLENADPDSYEWMAAWFGRLATKIMTRQYHKVAPLNGVLSRAQEYDADSYSYKVVGTEGAVSALSKLSYLSQRWNWSMNLLCEYMKEKRIPEDVFAFASQFLESENRFKPITPSQHLESPVCEISSRITPEDNTDTHPATPDRCRAILQKPYERTDWNDDPALSYFKDDQVKRIFNSIVTDIKERMYYGTTVFFNKDVTSEVLAERLSVNAPDHLDAFYGNVRFNSEETLSCISEEHPEYDVCPFTEENAEIIREYMEAVDDKDILERIIENNNPNLRYCYNGVLYTGTNVPINEHRNYLKGLEEKALEIMRHCNYWLDRHVEGGEFNLMMYAMDAYSRLGGLREAADTVRAIGEHNDDSTKAKEYVAKVDGYFRSAINPLLYAEDGKNSPFMVLADMLDVKDEAKDAIKEYFSKESGSIEDFCRIFGYCFTLSEDSYHGLWNRLKAKVITPAIISGSCE